MTSSKKTTNNLTSPRLKKGKPDLSNLRGKKLRQQKFISAYIACGFHIGNACEKAGVTREAYSDWKNDPDFERKFSSCVELMIDNWESALKQNIANGDTAAIIFALKTRGKHRGYVERESVNAKTLKILERILSGELTRTEGGYEFAKLGLPLPEVLKMELSRIIVPPENEIEESVSIAELERRHKAALSAVDSELNEFAPERKSRVNDLKDAIEAAGVFRDESE